MHSRYVPDRMLNPIIFSMPQRHVSQNIQTTALRIFKMYICICQNILKSSESLQPLPYLTFMSIVLGSRS